MFHCLVFPFQRAACAGGRLQNVTRRPPSAPIWTGVGAVPVQVWLLPVQQDGPLLPRVAGRPWGQGPEVGKRGFSLLWGWPF